MDQERQVYAMMTLMHPRYVPDWEVVSSTQNNDGSIELTVHAVSLSHGRDQVAVHRLRVMPLPDGTFHYLSNTIDYAEVNSDGMRSYPDYSPRITK